MADQAQAGDAGFVTWAGGRFEVLDTQKEGAHFLLPLVAQLLKAAEAEGEGAWRMPLGEAYAKGLKSRIADMKNVGGRYGGANIAAEFLRKFIKDETPWCHLDIAGVALTKSETPMAPAGATGWGVMTLNRLIADHFEG